MVWNGRLIRLAEFEEAGPDVALRQISWMMEQERIWGQFMKKPPGIPRDEWSPRVEWRADKTQMAIIQVLKQHFYLKASKGGPHSVRWGIRLVAERLAERNGTPGSYYLPYNPTTGLGCKAFPEAMERYRWPDTDGTKAPPTTPLKVDDDLVDADRYMHEAVDQPVGDPAVLYKNQLPSAIQGADLVGNIIDLFAAEAFTP